MKKPEFQELLSDYMLEISDPKNKDVKNLQIYIYLKLHKY